MRRSQFALLTLMLGLAAQPLVAATYYVGNCKPGAYGSISAAVASATVLPGSTIDVCPGTYPEQVVINKALTITGMFSGNSSQAVITVPGGGLGTTSSINPALGGGTIAAQVEVTGGPVNITNITVDGTTSSCPSTDYVGIFYSSGSSGTVNEVETRNLNCGLNGVGIAAENGAAASPLSVTIENSNIHDNTYIGVTTCSDQTTSTLTASIKGNYITGSGYGVRTNCNAAGTVSGNFIAAPNGQEGVRVGSPFATVSGNTVIGGGYGIVVEAAAVVSGNTVSNAAFYGILVGATGTITSNHIINNPYGIYLEVSGATVKSNAITKSNVGIEFICKTGTITGNTINGAATGIDSVPLGYSGLNKFYNVLTARTNGSGGC